MNFSNAAPRHARVDVADVLRGLAVLGIVLLHSIEHFNFYSYPDTSDQCTFLNFTDKAVWDGLFFLFGGKAYAIFALLFGFSFFIQHDNQRLRGKDFRTRFCWRLFLLFIIGNINAAFFTAEILVMYSLIGFVLVLTCRWSTRTLIWTAAILMIQPVAVYNVIRALADSSYVLPTVPEGEFWAATYEQQTAGSFLSTLRVNLFEGQLASLAWAWNHGRIFQTASLFILGMLIGRQCWFMRDRQRQWIWVLLSALIAFFPLRGLGVMLPEYITDKNILTPLALIVSSLSNFAFMLIIVAGVILAYYQSKVMERFLNRIIPYGRMSMTNYVGQSIIGSFLFYNWGLALHDRLGITASVFVGVGIFLIQYVFCRIWLRKYSHGPMELIWKKATWIYSGK